MRNKASAAANRASLPPPHTAHSQQQPQQQAPEQPGEGQHADRSNCGRHVKHGPARWSKPHHLPNGTAQGNSSGTASFRRHSEAPSRVQGRAQPGRTGYFGNQVDSHNTHLCSQADNFAEDPEEEGLDNVVAALRADLRAEEVEEVKPVQPPVQNSAVWRASAMQVQAAAERDCLRKQREAEEAAARAPGLSKAREALLADAPALLAALKGHAIAERLHLLHIPLANEEPNETAHAMNHSRDAANGHSADAARQQPTKAASQLSHVWQQQAASLDGAVVALRCLFPGGCGGLGIPGSTSSTDQGGEGCSTDRADAAGGGSPEQARNSRDDSATANPQGDRKPDHDIQVDPAHRPLAVLTALVQLAEDSRAADQPVQWGWCRELSAFVFVFEVANRIVVETPEYGHATYIFDLESPMPTALQVRRLIAFMRTIPKGVLLSGEPLDVADLSLRHRIALMAAGWTQGSSLASFLNFSGDRMVHKFPNIRGPNVAVAPEDVAPWAARLEEHLRRGALAGRPYKKYD